MDFALSLVSLLDRLSAGTYQANLFCRLIFGFTHRRRKVLNIEGGGARFRILPGPRGAKLFADCKLIGAIAPQSVPNNYISHIKN